jgi:enamine deaminase RidA (YjgF/YER057c/UK114 family)
MAWRESFNVPPMIHQNPIPTASRTGNMLYTSVISGRDLETGKVPESVAEQAANCFKILGKILEKGGATAGDVAKVTVFLKDNKNREHVNGPWAEMFPDANSRPARHAIVDPHMAGDLQIEAIAVVQGQ